MSNYSYDCKNHKEAEQALMYLINMGYDDKRCSPNDNHIVAFECGGMKQILSYDCDKHFHRLAYKCNHLSDFKEFINNQSRISELSLQLRDAIRNNNEGTFKKL